MSDPVRTGEPDGPRYRVHPDDEMDALAGLEELRSGRSVEVSPEEMDEWIATGKPPASVEARCAALGCTASQD